MPRLSWPKLFRRKTTHTPAAVVPTPSPDDRTPKYRGVAPKDRWDQIEFAFTSGGVNYFRFAADVNIPFQRAMAARDILTEELWQINPTMLKSWNEALIALVIGRQQPEKKLYEVGIMANRLKEQLSLSYSLTRTIKLATVLYFDEDENPLDYQYPYNEAKMKQWMAHNDIPGFFLNLPDSEFMPSLRELSVNFPTFLEAETTRMINAMTHITSLLQYENIEQDLKRSIILEKQTLEELRNWSRSQSSSIT
jgi:hypothetical protein